jgi:hypothetical protein
MKYELVDYQLTRQPKFTMLLGKFRQVCLHIIIFYLFDNQNLTFKFCTVVKPWAIHIEVNENGDVHISPTKKNVCAVRHLVNRTHKAKTDEVIGGSASTFDGFEELMESMLLGSLYTSLLCQQASEEGKHLNCSPAFRISGQFSPAFYVFPI